MFHVKHENHSDLTGHAVVLALSAAGISVSSHQGESIALHAREVLRANQTMNLTRITLEAHVLRLHIVDSLAWTPGANEVRGPVVDIGSGAGYPGIPLGVALSVPVLLCESVRKKAGFLSEVTRLIGFDGEVYPGRAEALARDRGEFAQMVVARAVAQMASLIELASPLLVTGGRLVCLKGRIDAAEMQGALSAAGLCGMTPVDTRQYALPGGNEARVVVEFVKTHKPSIALPRREGSAQRSPLG